MPPTFFIAIGAIVYFILMALAIAIGGLLMLIKKRKDDGKILILTAFISFPTLLIVGGTLTAIFAIPGIGITYLLTRMELLPVIGILFLGFVILVAFFVLYHWRLGYVLIRNYIKKYSIHQGIANDRVYNIFIKRVVNYFGFK